jgi:hypothetical protein
MDEQIQLWDVTRFVLEDFLLHDVSGDGVFWRGHDRDDISGAMINGRLKDIGQDGIDIHVDNPVNGGAATDMSRSVVVLKNVLAFEGIGRVGQPDQCVTPHDEGTFVIDGGRFESQGTKTLGPATGDSPLIVRNARITGKVDGHVLEFCDWDGGSETSVLFGNSKFDSCVRDCRIRNIDRLTVQGGGEIARNMIEQTTANNALLLFQTTGASHWVESCVLLGNGNSSNRGVQGNTGSGMDIVIRNCGFYKFGIGIDLSSTFFNSAALWHNVFLGCGKFNQNFNCTRTGRWNYYDAFPTSSSGFSDIQVPTLDVAPIAASYARGEVSTAGRILSGTGASAYAMRDYANDDFGPVLPVGAGETFHKIQDWGDRRMAEMAERDVRGTAFGHPTVGPFSLVRPRGRVGVFQSVVKG